MGQLPTGLPALGSEAYLGCAPHGPPPPRFLRGIFPLQILKRKEKVGKMYISDVGGISVFPNDGF